MGLLSAFLAHSRCVQSKQEPPYDITHNPQTLHGAQWAGSGTDKASDSAPQQTPGCRPLWWQRDKSLPPHAQGRPGQQNKCRGLDNPLGRADPHYLPKSRGPYSAASSGAPRPERLWITLVQHSAPKSPKPTPISPQVTLLLEPAPLGSMCLTLTSYSASVKCEE